MLNFNQMDMVESLNIRYTEPFSRNENEEKKLKIYLSSFRVVYINFYRYFVKAHF